MQAEIWRAASHSRFYTRYFRVFPGFLGLKSFLNFFKKRVFGADFHPSKQLRGGSESSFTPSPACFVSQNFLRFFPAPPPGSQVTGQSGRQIANAARRPTHPSNHLEKDRRTRCPRLRNLKPPETANFGADKFWRQRKSPEANLGGLSGAVDET